MHRAAGSERRHEPGLFLSNQQTKELLDEITGIPVFTTRGRNGSTYACKELVYAYANWSKQQNGHFQKYIFTAKVPLIIFHDLEFFAEWLLQPHRLPEIAGR